MNCTTSATTEQTRSSARPAYVRPLANITESPEAYVVEAELPGVNKEGLEVTVEKGHLTIVGRRTAPRAGKPLYQESLSAPYRRVFELDASIDVARISAALEHGVLRLQLPKAESVKPRKIEIAG